jgi:Tfp pilus assembly protein PilW
MNASPQPRPVDRDTGASLIELVVAMAAMSIAMIAVTGMLITTSRLSRAEIDRVPAQSQAQDAVDAIARSVRAATVPSGETEALLVATSTALTFYAQLNRADALTVSGVPVPTKVELYLSGNCLYRALTPARALAVPVGSSVYAWDTGRTAACLARSTPLPSDLFSYYTGSTATTPISLPGGGLGAATRATVRSVQVDVQLTVPGSGVRTSRAEDRVSLVNLLTADWR